MEAMERKKVFMDDLNNDIEKMSTQLKKKEKPKSLMGKAPSKNIKTYSEDVVDKKLMNEKKKQLRMDLRIEQEKDFTEKLEKQMLDDVEWSSGLESDHDVDLLAE